ncbi:hypothetical protein ILUMI_13879 [Ignelater luminosus]|uniref:Sodefrin-like factor n=1 Tax=Ignelater luminosus TaxID=2038154 RepID=A0A8K0CXN2_IGNLU|nr:hypothetical protein ILUMI_13879 [Ignelater luminosus]
MSSVKILILCICIVILQFYSAEALECYQCKGKPDSDCAKGVISAMETVECPGGALAMCSQTDLRSGSEREFDRGCTKYSKPDLCTLLYQLAAQYPIGLKVFSCNICSTPKCNTHTTRWRCFSI